MSLGRLFRGSTLCHLSYTALLTKITHTHTNIPPTFCSPSYVHFILSRETGYSTAPSSLSAFIVCTYIPTVCVEMGGGMEDVHWDRTIDCWQIRNAVWRCTTGEWLEKVLSFFRYFWEKSVGVPPPPHTHTITDRSTACHDKEAFSSSQGDTRWLADARGQIASTESRSTCKNNLFWQDFSVMASKLEALSLIHHW